MFGLFGKKKEKQPPVILDLSVKEKPDGWDELIRLGFEPVFVNHRPRPNGISGDYVQTRWRLKANPDVTCTVYDSWEGGGGATFLDFDAPWNPRRIHGGYNLSWPNYTLDRLHSFGKVLFEGDRSEFKEPDSGNLDLRGITPDPVREKMRELGFRMEWDDSHDSNGDDSDEEYWCKYDQGELRDLHRSRLALYAHVDRTAGTVAIVDVETGKQATLGFDKLLKLDRIEYGKKSSMTGPDAEELESIRKEYRRQTERDEGGIMSLETVRRLAWTAIVLFIMAIVFAFNHGPILAWLAANHTPLLVGLLQSLLWLVAFLLVVLGLQCWLSIVDDDETPFAIGMHALGIMLGIGWWAGLAALSSHQPADANCYGLLGGCILFGLFAWIMDRRQKAGREAFPRLRDQIADFAVTYIASEEYRKNNGDGE